VTTASVYYDNQGQADFVLIDGNQAHIHLDDDDGLMGGEYILRAVDRACRTLGWRVMQFAPIVRQFGGLGKVRVQPHTGLDPLPAPAPYLPDSVPAVDPGPIDITGTEEITSGATVYITVNMADWPIRVSVDGRLGTVFTDAPMSGIRHADAQKAIDKVLTRMGYQRTGAYGPLPDPAGEATWGCTAEVATVASPDWRDQPTLVRMDEATATLLTRTAALLDIPADHLASTWIRAAAGNALTNYDWFTDGRNFIGQARIKGWLHDGTPKTEG
jgi:hypothetical protein